MQEPYERRQDNLKEVYDRLIDQATKMGALEAHQKAMDNKLTSLEQKISKSLEDVVNSQKALDDKLDTLVLSQENLTGRLEGGWKALTVVGGIAVVFGGFIAWVVDKWSMIKGAIL